MCPGPIAIQHFYCLDIRQYSGPVIVEYPSVTARLQTLLLVRFHLFLLHLKILVLAPKVPQVS